jgi:3-phytase
MNRYHALAALTALALNACAPAAEDAAIPAVQARGETIPVGTVSEDAADDPAIWRNPDRPEAGLIVATDKKAGLYVYGLDGRRLSFLDAGRVNNVDLVDLGRAGVIVVASDRNNLSEASLQVYRLDTAAGALTLLGVGPGGAGEGYGLCLGLRDGILRAYSVLKEGRIHEVSIDLAGAQPVFSSDRTLSLASQPEGCVVDNRNGALYVGEEGAGVWRFDKDATSGVMVAPVDNRFLVADVEGLALAPAGQDGGYIIASSQGDNAYAVFSLPSVSPAGRFRIAGGIYGSTEETDGIDLGIGDFGPLYPKGLFVAQDGENAPSAQNFKLVSWADVVAALALE